MRTIFTFLFLLFPAFHAHAHFGHVGELAGHAHWIGTGVIVVGSILVGVLGTKKAKGAGDEKPEDEQVDDEQQGEAA